MMDKLRMRAIAVAIAMLSVAVLVATATRHPSWLFVTEIFADKIDTKTLSIVGYAVGVVLMAFAALLGLTSFDSGRSRARLRLDWFLPALKRSHRDQSVSHSALGRWLRRLLPEQWQSDRTTKQRGRFRKWIRRLGRSWLLSPVRRVVQTVCLILFFALFFYVCWPYDARPADPAVASPGWSLKQIDQESGHFILVNPNPAIADGDRTFKKDRSVFLTAADTGGVDGTDRIGGFLVSSVENGLLRMVPEGDISEQGFDALLSAGSEDLTVYDRDPSAWPSHYADNLARKEVIPAETFLVIDPLVSLSTAIASRSWVASLAFAAAILIVCVLIPRGFCGYVCPLGTVIDLFDWSVGKRVQRLRVADEGWWVHIKYYLLAGTLVAAVCGVLVSGFFSAIPVITRAMLFLFEPFVGGANRGWHLVPAFHLGHAVSVLMFASVLGLGLLRPRFWCKYVCPSGAVFSLGNLFRVTERKVESSCINCNKCVEVCPFDAIKPDFTTRTTDCTMCQTCGGVCPTHAIKFVERSNVVELKVEDSPPTNETALGRRGFLSLAAGGTAAAAGGVTMASVTKTFGAKLDDPDAVRLVRPPGSVPEQEFLEMCIRCGECFKACPNNVLQPEGFQQGLEGLWTPMVVADWAGCESSCNACGQVCPTGAIRPLPIEEKRVARMGLAVVNDQTCLPFAGREACDLCVQECDAAGYHAIEYTQVGVETDDTGSPIEGTGYLTPIVIDDLCVGCGLCQTRCVAINVKEKGLLSESAIIIEAGEGKEDRLMHGSYIELRNGQPESATASPKVITPPSLPQEPSDLPIVDEDPFGLNE